MLRAPLLALLVLAWPGMARADRQAQCIEEFEKAQRTRKSGALIQARGEFRACAAPSCPAMVRKDCTDALAELGTAIPSVRPRLEDAAGEIVSELTLEIDGARVELDGEPIELDPGEHVLVFIAGNHRIEKRVVLRKGEVGLPVVATLTRSKRPSPTPSADGGPGPPVLAWVLGGVAVVGAGAFVGFGLAGKSTESCKGKCSDDEIDTLHRQYLLADIGLGVAVVGGAVAGYLFLAPNAEKQPAKARAFLTAGPTRAGAALSGGFFY